MRLLILKGEDFAYNRFVEKGCGEGRSGPLLIGEKKDLKLLVKHTYPVDSVNEFVACYIGEQLGFHTPRAYLLTAAPEFTSDYAVGIEFMDFQPIQSSHLTADQLGELIHQVSLNGLVFQEDVIQLAMWKDHVVSYDFSIAFSQEEEFYRLSDSLHRYSQYRLFYPEVALEMLRLPQWYLPVVKKVYYEGIRPVVEMDTSPLFEALDIYFPERIAEYYEACVIKMQERVREKLAEYDRHGGQAYL